MYAFYSLLVYIFYTVFKKEEEEASLEGASGESPEVCVAAVTHADRCANICIACCLLKMHANRSWTITVKRKKKKKIYLSVLK